jgi:hypothetical protein
MKESYSLFYGTCLTFCHKRAITTKDKEYLMIKQGLELNVFIHDPGDEELILARWGGGFTLNLLFDSAL